MPQLYVSCCAQGRRDSITVLLCSEDGNLAVWPDFLSSDAVDTQRVPGTVTALAAAATARGGFLAVAATSDGALHHIQGGAGPVSVRRLSHAAPAAPSQQVERMQLAACS